MRSTSKTLSSSSGRGISWIQEPYRLLFPLGILCGVQGIGHWFFYGLGWIPSYSSHLHASIQSQAYMLCFIAGFLMTAMPRMSGARPASLIETGGMVLGLVLMLGFLYAGQWAAAEGTYAALLLWVLRFAAVRRPARAADRPPVSPPAEFLWVPCALLMGLAGTGLLAAARANALPAALMTTGKLLVQQGFLLGIVLGVGGFLGPRLMGTFQVVKHDEAAPHRARQKKLTALAGAAFLFLSFWIEGAGWIRAGGGLRALVTLAVLIQTRSLVFRPVSTDPFVRYLWLSFWLVAAGTLLPAFFSAYRLPLMHLTFLGGYSLMTFAVATMVILSHAGQASLLKKPWLPLEFTAAGILAAMAVRVASVFFPAAYFPLLALASGLWVVSALSWLAAVFPYLFRGAEAAELERLHEEAKQRILKQMERSSGCGPQTGCSPAR